MKHINNLINFQPAYFSFIPYQIYFSSLLIMSKAEGTSTDPLEYTWDESLLNYLAVKLSSDNSSLLPNTNETNVRDNIEGLLQDEFFPEDLIPKSRNSPPPTSTMSLEGHLPLWVHKIAPIVLDLLTRRAHHRLLSTFEMLRKSSGGPIVYFNLCRYLEPGLIRQLDWSLMGMAISQYPSLEELSLSNGRLSSNMIARLLGAMESSAACPMLRSLELKGSSLLCYPRLSPISGEGTFALSSFLRSRSNLKTLNLENTYLGNEEILVIAEALDHTNLEELYLQRNSIGDVGLETLLETKNAPTLEVLYLDDNNFSRRATTVLATFLGRKDIALRILSTNCENGSRAKTLLESIPGESKLERIGSFGSCSGSRRQFGTRSKKYLDSIAPHLTTLMCDKTSLGAICQSNHNLWDIGLRVSENMWKGHEFLRESFAINKRLTEGGSVANRMRSKLRKFYFKEDFDIQPFLTMDVKLMPHVLELVTRDEISCQQSGSRFDQHTKRSWYTICYRDSIDGIYRIVRNCQLPSIFSFSSPDFLVKPLKAEIASLQREKAETLRADTELPTKTPRNDNGNNKLPNKRPRNDNGKTCDDEEI